MNLVILVNLVILADLVILGEFGGPDYLGESGDLDIL